MRLGCFTRLREITFGLLRPRSATVDRSAATTPTLGWQPFAWLVVRIPYADRDHAERDELDLDILERAEAMIRELDIDGGEAKLLDHVGISEWMYEVIEKGLRA